MLDVKENQLEDRVGGRPGPTKYEQVTSSTAQHHDICSKGYSSEERIEGRTNKKKKKKAMPYTKRKRQNKELILKENRMELSEENKRQ